MTAPSLPFRAPLQAIGPLEASPSLPPVDPSTLGRILLEPSAMPELTCLVKELWVEPRGDRVAFVIATGPEVVLPDKPFVLDVGGGALLRFRFVADLGPLRFHESDGFASPGDGLPDAWLCGPDRDRVIPSGITGGRPNQDKLQTELEKLRAEVEGLRADLGRSRPPRVGSVT